MSGSDCVVRGIVYEAIHQHPDPFRLALSKEYTMPILADSNTWTLPVGAFGEDAGPT